MEIKLKIRLDRIEELREFVGITGRYPYRQELRQGRYVVDARSILGIMSLDLSHAVEFWCECYDKGLLDEVSRFKTLCPR